MAKKKMTKTARRRLTIITPIVFLAIGYCAFTLITTAVSIYQLKNEKASLKEELTDLKGESQDLKTEINKLQDPDYVARYARENYLYTRDGEYVIKSFEEEEKTEKKGFELNEEYIFYGCVAIGALVLFYVIFKARKHRKETKKKNKK